MQTNLYETRTALTVSVIYEWEKYVSSYAFDFAPVSFVVVVGWNVKIWHVNTFNFRNVRAVRTPNARRPHINLSIILGRTWKTSDGDWRIQYFSSHAMAQKQKNNMMETNFMSSGRPFGNDTKNPCLLRRPVPVWLWVIWWVRWHACAMEKASSVRGDKGLVAISHYLFSRHCCFHLLFILKVTCVPCWYKFLFRFVLNCNRINSFFIIIVLLRFVLVFRQTWVFLFSTRCTPGTVCRFS